MFETLLNNYEEKTSCALSNLHLALMGCLSVPLAYLFNPWFTKMGLEWVQFPDIVFRIYSKYVRLYLNYLNSLSDKAPKIRSSE